MEEKNNQIKVKLTTIIVLISAIAIIIIGIIFVILNKNNDKVIDEESDMGLTKFSNEENIMTKENITEDEGIKFINNEVLIMFNSDVEESRCEEIINEIDGKIITIMDIIKLYVVQVNYKFTTYSSFKQYCEMLEETYDEIKYATYDDLFEPDLF